MKIEKKIPTSQPYLKGNELKYVSSCVKNNWISSQGEFISQFENKFAKYCGCKYGVAVSNGTVALHLALVALGLGRGDEVIVPDLTFVATINAVIYTGATPVLVDVDYKTWNINAELLQGAITKRTKVIIPVHLYGLPCKMDEIMKMAKQHHLFVIEDCAEAHGAKYKGKMVGSFSDISCFSFFGNKIMTTGEGGMCLTNNEDLYKKMHILRDHGKTPGKQYLHEVVGFNYRMTNMQAAVGLAQLEKIDRFLKERDKIAKVYERFLSKNPQIFFQAPRPGVRNVTWLFTILVPKSHRNKLIDFLSKKNIDARPMFIPLHQMPPYTKYISPASKFNDSNKLSEEGLSLPTFIGLKANDIKRVADVINEYFNKI